MVAMNQMSGKIVCSLGCDPRRSLSHEIICKIVVVTPDCSDEETVAENQSPRVPRCCVSLQHSNNHPNTRQA